MAVRGKYQHKLGMVMSKTKGGGESRMQAGQLNARLGCEFGMRGNTTQARLGL